GEDFTFVDFNKAGEGIENIKREKLIGKSVNKMFPGVKGFGLFDVFKRVWKTGKPENYSVTLYKDERISGWRDNYVYKLPSGEIVAVYSDETERKQSEKALSEAYRIINRSPAVVFLWKNSEGWPVEFVSDNVKNLFGYTAEEFTSGKVSYALTVHPDDLEKVTQEVTSSSGKEGMEDFGHKPYRIFTKDGETKWLDDMTFIRRNEKGDITHYQGIVLDITERKKAEEELLRAQKLESLGILAGGIAHDFNNILTTILGNVSMARMQVAPEGEPFEMLSEAETASIRAQKLTKQLLTFAKGGAPVKETTSIKDILKESPSFVLRGSKSRCEFSIAEDLWPAEIDVGQISQVINNIVINANQAMPEGGIIQVAAENLIINAGHGLPVNPGRYIRISIKDQGVGIAEKHLKSIFDPYFTTKHDGSGLGLATTYSIIEKHEGHITVESRLGAGTTFHIYLPASDKAVLENEEVRIIKGQGRILVMDDEAPLRKMLGRMLKNLDYESEFAKDGAEALRMYKDAQESETPYDVVILDLTIPGGMGGTETIKKLLEIDPEVKAIVYSGYSDDPVLSNFQEYGFKGMMPKPFESQSLSKVLHEVLKGEKE
ncbi:MAG: ATP-binding protein, partial [Desulfatiglandaceae bacterium]